MRTAALTLDDFRSMGRIGGAHIFYVPPSAFTVLAKTMNYIAKNVYDHAEVVYSFDVAPSVFVSGEEESANAGVTMVQVGFGKSEQKQLVGPLLEYVAKAVEEKLGEKYKDKKKLLVFVASDSGVGNSKEEIQYYSGVIEGAYRFSLKRGIPVLILTNRADAIPVTLRGASWYLIGVDETIRETAIKIHLSPEAAEVALFILPSHISFLTTNAFSIIERAVNQARQNGLMKYDERGALVFNGEWIAGLVKELVDAAEPLIRRSIYMNVDVKEYGDKLEAIGGFLAGYYDAKMKSLKAMDEVRLEDLDISVMVPLPPDEIHGLQEVVEKIARIIPGVGTVKKPGRSSVRFFYAENLLMIGALGKASAGAVKSKSVVYDEAYIGGHEAGLEGKMDDEMFVDLFVLSDKVKRVRI